MKDGVCKNFGFIEFSRRVMSVDLLRFPIDLPRFSLPAILYFGAFSNFHEMKRTSFLILFLFALSGLAGYLLSKASLVGRVGISLFYQQYRFLKVWWQAGLLVLAIWMVLLFLQRRAQQRLSLSTSKLTHMAAIAIALAGFYFTYLDFRHSIAHRWLGERFHLGGYLFWIGWIVISVYYLTEKRRTTISARLSESRNNPSTSGNAGVKNGIT